MGRWISHRICGTNAGERAILGGRPTRSSREMLCARARGGANNNKTQAGASPTNINNDKARGHDGFVRSKARELIRSLRKRRACERGLIAAQALTATTYQRKNEWLRLLKPYSHSPAVSSLSSPSRQRSDGRGCASGGDLGTASHPDHPSRRKMTIENIAQPSPAIRASMNHAVMVLARRAATKVIEQQLRRRAEATALREAGHRRARQGLPT